MCKSISGKPAQAVRTFDSSLTRPLLSSPLLSSPLLSSPSLFSPLLSSPSLFSPLLSGSVLSDCPPLWPFTSACLMIWSFLLPPSLPSLHPSLLSPRGSWDWGLRGKRADWVCPFRLLCLLSPSPLSTSLSLSSYICRPSISWLLLLISPSSRVQSE